MGGEQERRADLVLEGGGVKGVALVGALAVLEERGYQPQNLAGTSIGAVVATLFAAGYTATELREIVLGLDFRRFQDRGWEDRIPLVGAPLSVLKDQGIYEGEAFLGWMRGLLDARGVRTFRDLVHPGFADQPRYRYRVQVIASDITNRQMLVLPRDAPRLGVGPDDLEVALAVQMSASIPVYFEPVRWREPGTDRERLIVDGGILSNFPVWLFDVDAQPEWPTFGLLLVNPGPRTSLGSSLPDPDVPTGPVGETVEYFKGLVGTMMEAHDRLYMEEADFARTITIPTLGVHATEFDLPRERKLELYESGRAAAERFLETWDFEGYIAEYRSGKEHSRRVGVAERMRRAADAVG